MAISQITSNSIAAGAVSASDLADASITPTKLSTGAPYWDSSGNVGIGTTNPQNQLHINGTSTGYARFQSTNRTFTIGSLASAYGFVINDVDANSERLRIDAAGNLLVNTTAPTYNEKFSVAAGGAGINTAMFRFTTTDDRDLMIMRHARGVNGSSAGMINFQNAAGTQIGSIYTVNGSSTVYGTSSDYRLKENIAPMTGALAVVGQLKPCTYTWKADGSSGQGFIAHELQAVVPDAVVGEKDAVNEDGSIKPQGIDTSFLVATLTAAIQELKAEFDEYKRTHP